MIYSVTKSRKCDMLISLICVRQFAERHKLVVFRRQIFSSMRLKFLQMFANFAQLSRVSEVRFWFFSCIDNHQTSVLLLLISKYIQSKISRWSQGGRLASQSLEAWSLTSLQ